MNFCTPQDRSFLHMAIAYLEVGRVASSSTSQMRDFGSYQNAVAYQLFHAIELFYKFMIKKSGGVFEHSHDLKRLEAQYLSIYSDPLHVIEHPFDFSSYESNSLSGEEKQLIESHQNSFSPKYMSQHLRYPADDRTGGYSFSIDESYFNKVKERMLEVSELCGC